MVSTIPALQPSIGVRLTLAASFALHLCVLALVVFWAPRTIPRFVPIELSYVSTSGPLARPERAAVPLPKRSRPVIPVLAKDPSPQALAPRPKPVATLSAAPTAERPVAGAGNPVELEARERYISEIAGLLNAKKHYPSMARRLGQQGKVLVQFRMARDGKVLHAQVLEKTPYDSLNEAARSLIDELNGLKPFPDEVRETTWLFTVPIEYKM